MEPIDLTTREAAQAAIAAYRAARRARASRRVADDVALARFRAYFPLATGDDCRGTMRVHMSYTRLMQGRTVSKPLFPAVLVTSN